MQVFSNTLQMVGRTPMLEVSKLDTGPCQLFLKLELMNPGGSIKEGQTGPALSFRRSPGR